MLFSDRVDAAWWLTARLEHLRCEPVVVLGVPRGGVPVALEVARELAAPLDIVVVRKIGVPFQPGLPMGAAGEDGVNVINRDIARPATVPENELAAAESRAQAEVELRAARYRARRPREPLAGRVALIVDDGVATGTTARAACRAARARGAARVVVAVPVAPPGWEAVARDDADELICVHTPAEFHGHGTFYASFPRVTDDEVMDCLNRAAALSRSPHGPALQDAALQGPALQGPALQGPALHQGAGLRGAAPKGAAPKGAALQGGASRGGASRGGALRDAAPSAADPPEIDEEVEAVAGPVRLAGHLAVPEGASGIVVFAHGSGSSRHSPRNRYVASILNGAGLGTLLFDLLTPQEELDRANVFDIGLLAGRLAQVTRWLRTQPPARNAAIGYFGASTGAAAALWAAAEPGADVAAVVSRGGRPDLARPRLTAVTAPTLLIVGGLDEVVLDLNRRAQAELRGENELAVVAGATHLFEEPGALDAVATLARDWFIGHI